MKPLWSHRFVSENPSLSFELHIPATAFVVFWNQKAHMTHKPIGTPHSYGNHVCLLEFQTMIYKMYMLYSTKPKSSNHKMHGFHKRLFPEATDQVTSMVILQQDVFLEPEEEPLASH